MTRPTISSDMIRRRRSGAVAASTAGRTVDSSRGVSIKVTLTARNNRICVGILTRE
jgi:hypothetical protein